MKQWLTMFSLGIILSVTAQAATEEHYEVVITHVPQNIDIVKQCGNVTQTQSTQVINKASDDGSSSFHFKSASNTTSTTISGEQKMEVGASGCTLTIRTQEPCPNAHCQKNLDFVALKNTAPNPS